MPSSTSSVIRLDQTGTSTPTIRIDFDNNGSIDKEVVVSQNQSVVYTNEIVDTIPNVQVSYGGGGGYYTPQIITTIATTTRPHTSSLIIKTNKDITDLQVITTKEKSTIITIKKTTPIKKIAQTKFTRPVQMAKMQIISKKQVVPNTTHVANPGASEVNITQKTWLDRIKESINKILNK